MNTKNIHPFLIRFVSNSLSIAVLCIVLTSIVHCSSKSTPGPTPEESVVVTFSSRGGSAVESQTVVVNALATEPTDPTRANFQFAGWYTDEAAQTTPYSFSTPVTEAFTLYAGWADEDAQSFTITFNTGDGGSDVPTQEVFEDKPVAEPAKPTREGFQFAGWYTDEATTEEPYSFSNPVTEAFTLYARWVAAGTPTVTITFSTGEGASAVESEDILEGDPLPRPTNPTRDGFRFAGWFTDEATTEAYNFDTRGVSAAPVTEAFTLYAGWTPIPTWEVMFNTGAGGSAVATESVLDSDTIPKPADPRRDRFRFTGWFTDEATTEAYNFGKPVTEAFTLYAGWIRVYTLSFETNGGNPIDAIPIESGSGRVVASPGEPTFDPSTGIVSFVGWFTSDDLSDNTEYTFGETLTSDPTIYARWRYQVAYDRATKAITGLDPEFIRGKTEGTIDLIIPSKFNGAEIDSIGQNAFKKDRFTRTVTIKDDGLKRIGDSAFYLARNWVAWPTLPNTLESIGSYSMYLVSRICNIPETSSPLVIPTSVNRIDPKALLYIRAMEFENPTPPLGLARFIDFDNIKSYIFSTVSTPLDIRIPHAVSRVKNCNILVPNVAAASRYVDAIPPIRRQIIEGGTGGTGIGDTINSLRSHIRDLEDTIKNLENIESIKENLENIRQGIRTTNIEDTKGNLENIRGDIENIQGIENIEGIENIFQRIFQSVQDSEDIIEDIIDQNAQEPVRINAPSGFEIGTIFTVKTSPQQ